MSPPLVNAFNFLRAVFDFDTIKVSLAGYGTSLALLFNGRLAQLTLSEWRELAAIALSLLSSVYIVLKIVHLLRGGRKED